MNIILTGMRGCGKTSLGKELAKKINWKFIDIDQLIETRLNKKIDQYVNEFGWPAFRKIEQEVTLKCAKLKKTVISTGGGTMINPKNASALKKNGFVVLLTCPLEILRKNLLKSYDRPSLTEKKDSLKELDEVWEKRKEQYYAIADIIHDTSYWPNLPKLLEKLLEKQII